MKRGPVEVMALAFPVSVTPDRMAAILRRPVDGGNVRLIDLAFLLRDDEGQLEVRDVEHDLFIPALAGMAFDPHTLLSEEDIEVFAISLAPDQQGMVAVIEHAWAADVAQALDGVGAELAFYARVSEDVVEAAFEAENAAG
jgi:hypothetical protein